MCIPTIGCSLPICNPGQERQPICSLITKITSIVLGAIALLVGTLVLCEVSGLQAVSTAGGWSLIASGAFLLFAAVCVRCIACSSLKNQKSQIIDSNRIMDSRLSNRTYRGGSTTINGVTTTDSFSYRSLESFSHSQNPNDVALRDRLTQELGTPDLTSRLKENFLKEQVQLALPIKCINEIRDDEYLFGILKLIYLPITQLLAQPLEEVKTYNNDQIEMLCLRLMHVKEVPQGYAEGTLGAFLNFRAEIPTETSDLNLYPFLTQEQVLYFLQNRPVPISKKIADALFPFSESHPFTTARSEQFLKELPIDYVNSILPFLKGQLVWSLINERGAELNYHLVTSKQINEMLPTSFMEESNSQEKIKSMPIEILNCLLPKMSGQLKWIRSGHLSDSLLNLHALSPDQIKQMFPASFMEKDRSKKRVAQLSSANQAYVKKIVNLDSKSPFGF